LERLGVQKKDAKYYLPSYEWYNDDVVRWAGNAGVEVVNFSPVLRTAADYTYPEMGDRYRSSDELLEGLYKVEQEFGLQGNIILIHLGVDNRRQDKFYNKLDVIIEDLRTKGYSFVRIDDLLAQ